MKITDKITNRLDSVSESNARIMNQTGSTIAGILFFGALMLFDRSATTLTALIAVAGIFDFSTVYFVHSGVISGTFQRLNRPKLFMRLHVGSGMIAYVFLAAFIVSLFTARIDLLYYTFLGFWLVTYTSGLYSFFKLR
ncbi:MAG: hypothetical protein H8Z69_01335 [Nanohaloarchaea archaeon]|nr:hypothetical protein [Candidatus Nanohaloarchaea archaeon]